MVNLSKYLIQLTFAYMNFTLGEKNELVFIIERNYEFIILFENMCSI